MRVLFVAGDLSGDQHAAEVARALKEARSDVEVIALGGPALEAVADKFLYNLVAESVVGFLEPIKKIPRFLRILNDVIKPALRDLAPDAVVPTDFFGFNRFTAKAAKEAGRKVFYLVSPQVWASRPGRIRTLKECVDRMLVIFPFEAPLYEAAGVPVTFVGHPYLDRLPEMSADAPMNVEPIVGLLPGSRRGEVARHLPLFLQTADLLAQETPNMRFILFAAPNLTNVFYDDILGPDVRRPYLLELVRDEDLSWRRGLDFALTCSGSATLENALLGVPMAVVYKTSWLTYQLAKRLVRVKYIAMANLLAEKELVPELIQDRATPALLAAEARGFLADPARRRAVRRELLSLRGRLGGPGFARRAAEEILRHII